MSNILQNMSRADNPHGFSRLEHNLHFTKKQKIHFKRFNFFNFSKSEIIENLKNKY